MMKIKNNITNIYKVQMCEPKIGTHGIILVRGEIIMKEKPKPSVLN